MKRCLCCGKKIEKDEHICLSCNIKYGQSHVLVSQDEYQLLRYKEMMYDAQNNIDERYN